MEMSQEMDQMHASFREQIDLLTKMYEKQQADYEGLKNDIQSNLSLFSKRIDSKLFSAPLASDSESFG